VRNFERGALDDREEMDQRVERIERMAFEIGPRRDAGNVRVVAGRVADEQPIERKAPRERIVGRRAEPCAMSRVEAPAGAGLLDPVAQPIDRFGVEIEAAHQRRQRDEIEHFVAGQARALESEDAQRKIGDRRGNERALVGDRVGNEARRALRAAEHGGDRRRVEIDVGRHDRDVARFERRIVLEQRTQLIVQHLDFARPRVARVDLQCAVAFDRRDV
jgi:hypothetical protein